MKQETPYNPLDKQNLGNSVADALLARPVTALPPPDKFIGAGIYVIYYTGKFPLYAVVSESNMNDRFATPIYVGKAVPAGARKGGFGLEADPGSVLHKRLVEHADSIEQAENLDLGDFQCRYLVVDDIWIPLGESLLIQLFSPAWNRIIDGFGNHDPGSGRYNQQRSPWDMLHPGRSWAMKCKPHAKSEKDIARELINFLNEKKLST